MRSHLISIHQQNRNVSINHHIQTFIKLTDLFIIGFNSSKFLIAIEQHFEQVIRPSPWFKYSISPACCMNSQQNYENIIPQKMQIYMIDNNQLKSKQTFLCVVSTTNFAKNTNLQFMTSDTAQSSIKLMSITVSLVPKFITKQRILPLS